VGNKTIFANNAQIAGHVQVGDWAILGATTLVHQFVHIGAHAFTGMGSFLPQDLPPYVTAAGNTARPYGINSEGLKRRGFSAAAIALPSSAAIAQTKITVGKIVGGIGLHIPSYIAMDKGFFKEEGLDARWIELQGRPMITGITVVKSC